MQSSVSTKVELLKDPDPPITASPPAPLPISAFNCDAIQGPLVQDFYESNPTYVDPIDNSSSWIVSSPQAQNMDATRLQQAADQLQSQRFMWSFLVIRNGALVYERYYNGANRQSSNNIHSASKSLWGAAVGIAIQQGLIPSIDTPIANILPSRYLNSMDSGKRSLTVRHLLTMSSGLRWAEDSTEYTVERRPDRVGAILELPLNANPGQRFNYSTGDSHLMSAVLTEATGMSGCQYIHQNLLAPMGVVAERWGRDPQGYFAGGYNMYLTPREIAKFGQLYLNRGQLNGQQLVPSAWVNSSMVRQGPGASYGFNFWLDRINNHDVAIAWGYGGQMIYIVKSLNLVVVMSTNTRDFDQDTFNGRSILANFVIPSVQ